MAKLEDVTPALRERIEKILEDYSLTQKLSALILSSPKLKEIGKVSKASPVVHKISSDDVVIIINEDVFDFIGEGEDDEVKTALQQIVLEELLTGIEYNDKTSSVVIKKPDFTTYSGLLSKYDAKTIMVLHESIQSAKTVIKKEKPDGELVHLFDDIKEIFEEAIVKLKLEDLNIHILSSNKESEMGKLTRVSELAKLKHNDKDDVELIINQRIFELLDDAQRHIAAEIVLAAIAYDAEFEVLSGFVKPDFTTHMGILDKFTPDSCIMAHEAIKEAFKAYENALAQEEGEEVEHA
jgi:hypothetical protein